MNTQHPTLLMQVPPWDQVRRILADAMVQLASQRLNSGDSREAANSLLLDLASPDGALPMLPHVFDRGVPNILQHASVQEMVVAPPWEDVRNQLVVILRTFATRQPADVTLHAAEELLDFISQPRCGMPYLRGAFDFPPVRVESRRAGAELTLTAGDPANDAAQAVPPGHALVPIRMNAAMGEVVGRIGWTWDELLAAANAITDAQRGALASPGPESGEVDGGWHFVRFQTPDGWSRWTPARRNSGGWYSASYRGIADESVDVGPAISTPLPGAAGAMGSLSAELTQDLMRSIEKHVGADDRRADLTKLLAVPAAHLVEALLKVARGARVVALPGGTAVEQLRQPVDQAA